MSRSRRIAPVTAGVAMLVTLGAWIEIRRTGAGEGLFLMGWLVLIGAIIAAKISARD
jgi:hypothetical protein